MKLHVDLETLQLIEGPGFRNPVTALRFKRGDAAQLEVLFLRNGSTAATIGDPQQLELQFGVKPRGRYEAGYLAHTADWTMPALGVEKPIYQCSPSFNTTDLDAALNVGSTTELSEIVLMGEITWREGTGEPTSTRTFTVVVENDVNRGTEGAPATLPGPDEWLAARAASLPLVSNEDLTNSALQLVVSGASLVPNISGVTLVKTGTDLEGWDIYESGPLNGAGFDKVVISRYQMAAGRWGLFAMLGVDEVQVWTYESDDAYPAGESDWHPVFVLDAGTARVSAAPAPYPPAHPGHLAVLPDGAASRGWMEIDGVWRELAFAHSVATVSATLASLQTTGALDALAVSGNATISGELTAQTGSFVQGVSGPGGGLTGLSAFSLATGTVPFARLPTGTTSSTVAVGNHNHNTLYVALTGDQTISGLKTFINGLSDGFITMSSAQITRINGNIELQYARSGVNEGVEIFGTTPQVCRFVAATGNLGIGKTNPSEKLDVVGNGAFSGSLSVSGSITVSSVTANYISSSSITAGAVYSYGDTTVGGQLTAPSQTLANADHVVTRALGDGRYGIKAATVTEATTARTLTAADIGKYIVLTHSTSCAITVPADAGLPSSDGDIIYFRVEGTGIPTFAGAATISNGAAISGLSQYGNFALRKTPTASTWHFI